MAPKRAAITTTRPALDVSTSITPFPTVLATPSEIKAPIKFPIAAIASAFFALRALVATVVAIAFAASWKPLV